MPRTVSPYVIGLRRDRERVTLLRGFKAVSMQGVVALCSAGIFIHPLALPQTINPHVILDQHPLPRFEELMAKLNGGTLFSVIDLKDAYLQMRVHRESQKYLVIATHRGYFRYKRLPFGLSFAPALFQRAMVQILAGVEGVAVYIDDIIVTGCDEQQHMKRLHMVLSGLKKAGVRTRTSKCKFLCKSVTYLGQDIELMRMAFI
ncbi:hypothetical protein M513_07829 [Trichuris suis]|nr:hypothetical protein M513_07829 [Trichuris suis]